MTKPEQPFARRCLHADMRIRTAVIEAVPQLIPNDFNVIGVPLERQLKDAEEARWYALEASSDLLSDVPATAKSAKLSILTEPAITAVITIEMGDQPIGQI